MELVHTRDKAYTCGVIQMWDGLTPMWAGLFFLFVAPDVYYYFGIVVVY